MGEVTNIMEYQVIAKMKMAYDYASGAEDEWTLKENREAFFRILNSVASYHRYTDHANVLKGEYTTARAALAAGTIMTLSSWATSSVEVASTGGGIHFFQLYVSIPSQPCQTFYGKIILFLTMVALPWMPCRCTRTGRWWSSWSGRLRGQGSRRPPSLWTLHHEADIKNSPSPYLTLKKFEGLNFGKMDQAGQSIWTKYGIVITHLLGRKFYSQNLHPRPSFARSLSSATSAAAVELELRRACSCPGSKGRPKKRKGINKKKRCCMVEGRTAHGSGFLPEDLDVRWKDLRVLWVVTGNLMGSGVLHASPRHFTLQMIMTRKQVGTEEEEAREAPAVAKSMPETKACYTQNKKVLSIVPFPK
ncbi:hypothetical protein EJB05_12851 [Eragrostis curvula]|uniref:Uncharacterized protein n=1 Tax=Eragrostis curvula TaxID=38414 RepID=A0A5J9VSM5_9POAL|nr:hypothetical protein EJB05_12851 [Eragrostis curvula]